jgi:Ca2+-binding RTX toxin-like protein
MAIIKGTSGNDTLSDKSSEFGNEMYGYAGDDTLYGLGSRDYIHGGLGTDKLYGGEGDDWLFGEVGADHLDGGIGSDWLEGGTGNDKLFGGEGKDFLQGNDGADMLFGGSGNDHLNGGTGLDKLDGGPGEDSANYSDSRTFVRLALDGSLKATGEVIGDRLISIEDLVGSRSASNELAGNGVTNKIYGGGNTDIIYGRGGNDTLDGFSNADQLYGEAGNDWLIGSYGADLLNGGSGNDAASYSEGFFDGVFTVSLDGSLQGTFSAQGDRFVSIENLEGNEDGYDILAGNEVANFIWGLGGDDQVFGRAGADSLFGGLYKDELYGESGNDRLDGGLGADRLDGGDGNDTASYSDSDGVTVSLDGSLLAKGEAIGDTFISVENLYGSGTKADTLAGDEFDNLLRGFGGNDKIYGRAGSDSLYGDGGADRLYGGAGKDFAAYFNSKTGVQVSLDGTLKATGEAIGDTFSSIEGLAGSGIGNDRLRGNAGANEIHGNGGNDILEGGAGNDRINGGEGTDTLTGGAGSDTFYFRFATEDADKITDFTAGDKIELRVSGFTALAIGALAEEQFVSGAGHTAATDLVRVLFDTSSNTLWYDADGNGTEAAIRLATFTNGYQGLAAADFILTD